MCVQCIGGYHEYIGGMSTRAGGGFSTSGDIMMHVVSPCAPDGSKAGLA